MPSPSDCGKPWPESPHPFPRSHHYVTRRTPRLWKIEGMPNDDQGCDEVIARERELLTFECRSDSERVGALLHPDFTEHGASGRVWTRDDVLESLPAAPEISGAASDFHAYDLAPDVVLLTYRVDGNRASLRSSIWLRVDDQWLLRFHQGTLVP